MRSSVNVVGSGGGLMFLRDLARDPSRNLSSGKSIRWKIFSWFHRGATTDPHGSGEQQQGDDRTDNHDLYEWPMRPSFDAFDRAFRALPGHLTRRQERGSISPTIAARGTPARSAQPAALHEELVAADMAAPLDDFRRGRHDRSLAVECRVHQTSARAVSAQELGLDQVRPPRPNHHSRRPISCETADARGTSFSYYPFASSRDAHRSRRVRGLQRVDPHRLVRSRSAPHGAPHPGCD